MVNISTSVQPINSHISVYIREKGVLKGEGEEGKGGGRGVGTLKIYPKTKVLAKYEVNISNGVVLTTYPFLSIIW